MLATFSAQFTWIDWLVVIGYLALTTWLGAAMAGKQQTIRDFFLGGRKLPWYAVSGSIVATEISALTFVSVPWVVFQPGGNLTYLQLGVFGSFFARILVGYILVPVYYQREIYSPYDYMGHRLGGHVRGMTTALFTLGGMLAQSARIYLTAEVLLVILSDQLQWLADHTHINALLWAIAIISGVSVVWTLIGGMATVIWTDVVLFLAFFLGAIVALGAVVVSLDGGWAEFFSVGWEAQNSGVPWAAWGNPAYSGPWGKFTFFDFSADPARAYTIWTAMIASTWGGVGAYGTDQLMAQRMFCCRNAREARWAIISSAVSQLVTIAVALVGVGLFVYYTTHTPSPAGLELVPTREKGDRIFPVFIVEVVPVGLKGLIVAAIFAAAVSSVMGILTALSQTMQTAFYNPLRERYLRARGQPVALAASAEHAAQDGHVSDEDRRSVAVGRLLVIFWGVALSVLAYFAATVREFYPSILDLGLSMAGYCGGALLAGFALSFLPLRIDGRGFMYSGPLSVLCVFAAVWHQPWTHVVCWAGGALLLAIWIAQQIRDAAFRADAHDDRPAVGFARGALAQTLALLAGLALMLGLNYVGYWHATDASGNGLRDVHGNPVIRVIAWPWQVPLGSLVAFVWGYLLARPRASDGPPHAAN